MLALKQKKKALPLFSRFLDLSGGVQNVPEECTAELSALLGEEHILGATLLMLANKQDLSSAHSVDEVSKRLGLTGESVGKTRHWQLAARAQRRQVKACSTPSTGW